MVAPKTFLPALLACFLLASLLPAQEGLFRQHYRHSFKGNPDKDDGWQRIRPGTEQAVKFEPEGLRISLPASQGEADTGVVRGLAVKGDFEVTIGYEVLQEPAAGKTGTRFTLTAALDKPGTNMATLSYSVSPKGKSSLVAWMSLENDKPKVKLAPIAPKTGRLRLVRTAGELSFFAAREAEPNFVPVATFPFGFEDLQYISIAGAVSADDGTLDVRVADVHVRAEALPGLAPPPDVAAVVNAPPPPFAVPTPTPEPQGSGSLLWWLIGLMIVIFAAAGGWLYMRRRARQAHALAIKRKRSSTQVRQTRKGLSAPPRKAEE
jgi:hypothetical protein